MNLPDILLPFLSEQSDMTELLETCRANNIPVREMLEFALRALDESEA